jgi:hypothetical protein
MSTDQASKRILLGIGEEVIARTPTPVEQSTFSIGPDEPVLALHHTDGEADVMPAKNVTIAARRYGVVS